MSPKSLLRNKTVAKPIDEFTGGFKPIITEDVDEQKSKVILASGKMYIDLKEYLAKNPNDSILHSSRKIISVPRRRNKRSFKIVTSS